MGRDRLENRDRCAEESDVRPWQRRAAAVGYFSLEGLLTLLVGYASTMRPPVIG